MIVAWRLAADNKEHSLHFAHPVQPFRTLDSNHRGISRGRGVKTQLDKNENNQPKARE